MPKTTRVKTLVRDTDGKVRLEVAGSQWHMTPTTTITYHDTPIIVYAGETVETIPLDEQVHGKQGEEAAGISG